LLLFVCWSWFVWLLTVRYRSTGTSSTSTEDHKNEGFLKSIWHNLTNHPAHGENQPAEGDKKSPDGEQQKKSDDDPKKGSGSGSGSA